jgi:hypothetical protein
LNVIFGAASEAEGPGEGLREAVADIFGADSAEGERERWLTGADDGLRS